MDFAKTKKGILGEIFRVGNRHEKYKSVNRKVGYAELEIITPSKFMEVHHDNT